MAFSTELTGGYDKYNKENKRKEVVARNANCVLLIMLPDNVVVAPCEWALS